MLFPFIFVSFTWILDGAVGGGVFATFAGHTVRVVGNELRGGPEVPSAIYLTKKNSRVFLMKQLKTIATEYKRMVVDEMSKVSTFSEGITLHYGKIFIDVGDFGEKEFIYFEGVPFFISISHGELISFSSDTGHFLYCMKCEGDVYEIQEGRIGDSGEERARTIGNLISRNIFFLSSTDVVREIADDELHDLMVKLKERVLSKDRFAKDIIYAPSDEIPRPKLPAEKRFDTKTTQREIPSARQKIEIESVCFELLKIGVGCKVKK